MAVQHPWDRHDTTRRDESREQTYRYPTTETEWQDRYAMLRAAYHLDGYTAEEMREWHLFQAYDDNGKVIAQTRRLCRDFAFVIDRNADALFAGGLTLDLADGLEEQDSKELLAGARAIWDRSDAAGQSSQWAHNVSLGRMLIEVQRVPRESETEGYRAVLVAHPPETYSVTMDDQTGTRIKQVVITRRYFDADDVDENGDVAEEPVLHVYRRVLTEKDVTVYLDGERVAEESGAHNVGCVPAVNLIFRATREPEHGESSGAGLVPALALVDSMFTQGQAVGNRYGDPKPWARNINMSASSNQDTGTFGRWLWWTEHKDAPGEIGYLEPTMTGMSSLLAFIERVQNTVRETYPEFGLFKAGANASGEALRLLGQAFEQKVSAARGTVLPRIAQALDMALAVEADTPYDPDQRLVKVAAGPVLPADIPTEVATLVDLKVASLLSAPDAVRHLQRLGIVADHHDPETYATQLGHMDAGEGPFHVPPPGDQTVAIDAALLAVREALAVEDPDERARLLAEAETALQDARAGVAA